MVCKTIHRDKEKRKGESRDVDEKSVLLAGEVARKDAVSSRTRNTAHAIIFVLDACRRRGALSPSRSSAARLCRERSAVDFLPLLFLARG